MILFDYGHTLVNETGIDVLAGHAAVLSHAVKKSRRRHAADFGRLFSEMAHADE